MVTFFRFWLLFLKVTKVTILKALFVFLKPIIPFLKHGYFCGHIPPLTEKILCVCQSNWVTR